ncbi:discoidin domain-containing protein [Priestia megaterium]
MPVYMNLRRYVDKKLAEIGSGGNTGSGASIPKFPTPQDLPVTDVVDGQIAIVLSLDHIFLYDTTKGWVDTDIASGEVGLTKDETDTYYAPINHTHVEFNDFATKTELSGKMNTGDSYTKTEADTKFALKGEGGSGSGTSIDDSVASTTTTYSSQKIEDELASKVDTADVYSKTEADSKFALIEDIPSGGSGGVNAYNSIEEAPVPTELGEIAIIDGDIYEAGNAGASDTNMVPNMSGPTSGNITVSSSPVNSSSDVFYAFGTHETYPTRYFRTSSNANVYAMVDFGSPVDLGGFSLTTRVSDSYLTYYPKDFRIETSDDGVNFTTQKRYTGKTDWATNTRYKFALDNPVTARYIRIFVEITGGGNGFVAEKLEVLKPAIAYLQHSESKEVIEATYAKKADGLPLYPTKNDFPAPTSAGSIAVDKQTGIVYVSKAAPATPGVSTNDVSLIPKMTSNTLPSPYKALASKELSSSTAAYKAFDQTTDAQNVNNYFWTGNSRGTNVDWLSIGRTDGAKMLFNRINVVSSVAGANNYPKSATVEISNDAVTWTPIMDIADMGLTAGDQTYVINLPYAVEASYVRLNNFRATGYSGGYGPVVKEIQIITTNEYQWVETDFVRKIKNRTRIEATATNAMTITTTTRQIVPFDNVTMDANFEFDKTTYKATIKESGFYHIDSQLWLTYLVAGRYAIGGILINSIERRTAQIVGQQLAPSDGSSGYPAPQTIAVKESLWLNAGDTIQVYIQCDCKAGDTTSVSNTSTTRFTLNRLY